MPSEGWALVLAGDKIDLDDLREQLRLPFDPWVEDYESGDGTQLLLRTASWSILKDPRQVIDDANRLIEQINAASKIHIPDSKPVALGRIIKFRTDGSIEPLLVAGSMNITLEGCRVRAKAAKSSADDGIPAPSFLQLTINKASANVFAADALAFINRSDNWFDLFKAMESLEALLPGRAHEAKKTFAGWDDVRRTANHARHSPAKWEPLPEPPPTFEEAKTLVLKVARELI